MILKEKLQQYIDSKDINTSEFERSIGVSKSYWRNTKNISADVLLEIVKKYPELNIEWLITGKGSMLKSAASSPEISNIQEEGTPLLPVEAWGGSLSGSSIAVLAEQCKKYNVPISNIDYLIPIAGDSMMPSYCPGDVVAIKRVREKAFIEWGKVYVLDTCNGVVIKEVQPSENEGCITCVSHNLPERYKPFEVSLDPEDFYGMYAVKGTVRIS